jgi:pimeloyl-ACP methyl ester carboxylesterase
MLSQLKPPAPQSIFNEAFTPFEIPKLMLSAPGLAQLRSTKPRDIMVLPGFGAGDSSTLPIRGYLEYLGHRVTGWDRGLNTADVEQTMYQLVATVSARPESSLVLIGWSLGGYLAREVAREIPHKVEQVFTLGSPVVGGPKYTQLAALYKTQGIDVDWIERAVADRESTPLTTPVTAIYSKSDGIVAWQACIDQYSPNVEHIEIHATHIGLGISADVYRIIGEKLKS